MTATLLLYEGDIVQINRPEYPPYSKFRRGTIEWLEGESIGVRLDANDTLEQFLIDDCTLIARGEKYHYETKIAAQAERLRKLEDALRPFADCGAFFEHPITRLANEDRSLRSFSHTALLSDYVSNPIDRLKVRDFRRATRVYLQADSTPDDWTPFEEIVRGVDEDTAHGG